MIAAYMRWRNARAQPKTNFAPNSSVPGPVTRPTLPDEGPPGRPPAQPQPTELNLSACVTADMEVAFLVVGG
jgi:hypothetical protein